MGFFKRITGNIVKWWQLVILPTIRINNDKTGRGRFVSNQPENTDSAVIQKDDNETQNSEMLQQIPQNESKDLDKKGKAVDDNDAMAVMERINREKEEARKKEIEKAKMASDEDARITSIMNANKVDVNAFIQAGKKAASEKTVTEQPEDNQPVKDDKEAERKKEEDMRRAQEIMDRLNREAAEDEAKKQAEIEAARKQAEEQFG